MHSLFGERGRFYVADAPPAAPAASVYCNLFEARGNLREARLRKEAGPAKNIY